MYDWWLLDGSSLSSNIDHLNQSVSFCFDCGDQMCSEHGWPRQLWKLMVHKLGDWKIMKRLVTFEYFASRLWKSNIRTKVLYVMLHKWWWRDLSSLKKWPDISWYDWKMRQYRGAFKSSLELFNQSGIYSHLNNGRNNVGMATFRCHWTWALRRELITCQS